MSFQIHLLPAFADNYIPLIADLDLGLAMVVDPGDAAVVDRTLKEHNLSLTLILNTHHHNDHIGGNQKLAHDYGAPIIAPTQERGRIKDITRGVVQGDTVTFSTLRGDVIETHGHTSGHISYYFPALKALFCGDTLFSLGCGRLFEGTAPQMWESLKRLRSLPDDTQVYCAHEYTLANAKFATAVDPDNQALKDRVAEAKALRKNNTPTIPTLMGVEKATNPFLRADDPTFAKRLNKMGLAATGTDAAAVFGGLRAAKDRFKAA
ncbi:MAG: hydroxyacylglutathione hydrolase [Alphaproteobacteria bacterium]|nr:hydroxyacylglutathione hydrolase [Alphaproteobacteria bacterium]MBV8548841.1 hydroxyacylglutathione hydrolase [Alphaproteobacteria bacterium]